ncbi:MAG: bacteriohemerythrin [Lachnospiraceae bacterium]|nr:bacteriohemerythrin [Lachnospiraceae bacterium]
MYEMKPDYYTGIGIIDKEHEKLFSLANETHELLNDDLLHDKTESMTNLISELIDYTKQHFAHEELYMDSIHYANMPAHIVQHRKFEESLMKFDIDSLEDDREHQNETVERLLDFLIGWLIHHIQQVDMLYTK